MGVENAVVKRVALFTELRSQGVPELAVVGSFGLGDIFKNEIVGLQSMYSMDANFGSGASPFLVKEALLFSEFREGLARKSRNIDMDSALRVNVWVMPSIRTYFKWEKIPK